jgi:hypothetical protein
MENSNQSNTKFNAEKMSDLCDNIIRTLVFIKNNKEMYNNDKVGMLRLVKFDNPKFYDDYPRICRTLVFEDDITPLLGMIKTFAQVQEGKISFEKASNMITNALNEKYVDPILNSDKLVKERESKQKIIELDSNN